MKSEKNPYFVTQPISGKQYQLWSLPLGSKAIREGLRVSGKEAGPFEILNQSGTQTVVKTDWDYTFHLDASLMVVAVKETV